MFDRLDDTIVAISSPTGVSVRGIIRISGPKAFRLAAHVFECDDNKPLTNASGHKCIGGRIKVDAAGTVPAEAYTFRAPSSYTRQDVVELHTIGSPPILAMILEQLTAQGARPAEPGEFTARAYFSGAMDLTRVEGVAAIINARNDSQLRASEALLHGKLSKRTTELRDRLADMLALVEAEIDFVEEPIEFISREEFLRTIDEAVDDLQTLLTNAPSVEGLEVLPRIMLVGPPNAGKSTLFNRLTGMDRVIQSATAGTTRDVISAPLTVPGGELMLLDCAGLTGNNQLDPNKQTTDPESLAESASRRAMASADMILLIVDITEGPQPAIAKLQPTLPRVPIRIVANKIDKLNNYQIQKQTSKLSNGGHVTAVSALSGEGVETLIKELGNILFSGVTSHGSDVLALSNRQRDALRDAFDTLSSLQQVCKTSEDALENTELLALDIREAMNALSVLVGGVVTEDLLDRIFSNFCIGK
ncbi:MAG: tRNA modification GTPase [Planctomycetota bacterium]|jgi:tRNA modification GTPase